MSVMLNDVVNSTQFYDMHYNIIFLFKIYKNEIHLIFKSHLGLKHKDYRKQFLYTILYCCQFVNYEKI